jgi:hypothetical protein
MIAYYSGKGLASGQEYLFFLKYIPETGAYTSAAETYCIVDGKLKTLEGPARYGPSPWSGCTPAFAAVTLKFLSEFSHCR